MSAERISRITAAVKEVVARGKSWCATFEISGDPRRWVQFNDGMINAAYPYAETPGDRFGLLKGDTLLGWEPNKYATIATGLNDPNAIAALIERYLADVLACGSSDAVTVTLQDLDA